MVKQKITIDQIAKLDYRLARIILISFYTDVGNDFKSIIDKSILQTTQFQEWVRNNQPKIQFLLTCQRMKN